jgi:hypothetical protein
MRPAISEIRRAFVRGAVESATKRRQCAGASYLSRGGTGLREEPACDAVVIHHSRRLINVIIIPSFFAGPPRAAPASRDAS